MQDNWQDFDRQIGSMLQDAEVKAPRRVWRAVSARLGQAAAAAAWWRWAVPAFAVAALAALGLFLSGTFRSSGPALPGNDIIIAQNVDEPQEVTPAVTESEPQAVQVADSPASAPRRSLAAVTEAPEAAVPQVSEAEPEDQTVSGEAALPDEPVSEAVSDKDATDTAAQWAQIEKEDARQASRFRLSNLYAQGGVGGNDSNISYGGTGISRMAPGLGSPDAGISENSTSTYGIPFTLGLGARFHVAPRLSLGTGLEYSLLTRTFTGSYSDSYTGTIAHSVQYVGVPVNAYYDLMATRDGLLGIYAWGGGSAELCVGNSYRLLTTSATIKDKVGSMQFSAALGLGFEFRLSDKLGLYVDPAVRYYFHGNQPKSVRTDKPLMFSMDAGLRFSL